MECASATHWLGKRVLVTGASGFLGGAVARLLAELGAEVHGTGRSRLPPEGVIAHHAVFPRDAFALVDDLRPERVLHLAGPVDLGRDPALFEALRPGILDAADAVARACLAHGVPLTFVGTCEEYGAGEAPFRESDAPAPLCAYAALKAAAGAWVLALVRTAGLQATVLRPFRTYGPGDRTSVIALACRAALEDADFPMTDGEQVREWNHVEAMATGIVAASAHPGAVGRVLNLGGGPRASVRAVVEAIFSAAEADPDRIRVGALPRRPGEPDRFWADTSQADALLGPLPHVPLEDGLPDALEWMRAEGLA